MSTHKLNNTCPLLHQIEDTFSDILISSSYKVLLRLFLVWSMAVLMIFFRDDSLAARCLMWDSYLRYIDNYDTHTIGNIIWAGNFRMVDIEINAWSSRFLNLETNLINCSLYCKVYKIQPTTVAYPEPGNLKFCAPFKINIQKRVGLSNFENLLLDFLY